MNQEERIKSIIQEHLQLDWSEITNGAYLMNDLGADELDVRSLVETIEKELSVYLEIKSSDITVEGLINLANSAKPIINEPKSMRYYFAHKYLPLLIFKEGLNMFSDLRVKDGHDYFPKSDVALKFDQYGQPIDNGLDILRQYWDDTGKSMDYIAPDGLDYEILQYSGILMILFYFPEAQIPGEASCGLFTWDYKSANRLNQEETVGHCASYFTFEISLNDKLVLGEWLQTGKHANHGFYLSDTTINQFIDEVTNILQEKGKDISIELVKNTSQSFIQESSVNKVFSDKKIKEVELKKAWDFLCKLNDQLSVDQRFKIGLLPWVMNITSTQNTMMTSL
jgi:acyl carrier protein